MGAVAKMAYNGFNKHSSDMENERIKILEKVASGELTPEKADEQLLGLFFVSGRYPWLNKDDLDFAIALQEENRLDAVKWLCEIARPHSLTPLKTAKEILDAYR
jgi:hypothetical protein